jgi:hypothetical protein
LTKEEVSGLKKICVDKIRAAAHGGTLITNKNLVSLLHIWREWESEEAVNEYIARLIQTTAGLLTVLKGFEWVSFSHTEGDRVDKGTKKTNKKSLAMFTDIDELNTRVQALAKEELNQEDRETIALYNTPPDWFDKL